MTNYVMNAEKIKEGRKYDSEKPKMYLLPPKALIEVSRVLTVGAEKYDEENWRHLDNLQNRYTGSVLRHLFAHMDGELNDPETKYSHLAHAVCGLLFKLEIELEKDKEKRLREPVSNEHRKGDSPSKPQFFSPTFGGFEQQNDC